MASVVLSAVGFAIGGPIGGAVGSVIGGLADSYITNALRDPIQGARLDSLKAPQFDEGAPCPWVLGPQNRVPGQVIWVSPIIEVKKSSGGGSFFKPKPKTVSFSYFVDVAIAFARTVTATDSVRKIWAGGTLIYDQDASVNISSNLVSITQITVTKYFGACGQKNDAEYIEYTHTGGGGVSNFFKGVKSGQSITVSGASNANNNGSFKVVFVTIDADGVAGKSRIRVFKCKHSWATQTCVDTSGCTAGVTASAGPTITFVQNLPTFNPAQIEAVTIYNGSGTQTADPIMEGYEGVGNVPTYRGTTYVLLKKLQITKWGANFPNFEGLIREATTRTVAESVGKLVEKNLALTSSDYDTSAVASANVQGFVVQGPQSPLESLKRLMLVFDLEAQERPILESQEFKTKLFFFSKPTAPTLTISDGDESARSAEEDSFDRLDIRGTDSAKLPQEITVNFIDPDRDWQPGSRSFRIVANPVENVERISLPMVLATADAVLLAKKLIWMAHVNKNLVHFRLPPSYLSLAEGDVVSIRSLDEDTELLRVKVLQVDQGVNGILDVEGVVEFLEVYTQTGFAETQLGFTTTVGLPTALKLSLADLPPLEEEQANLVGLLFGLSTYAPDVTFPNGTIFVSFDNGSTYADFLDVSTECTAGYTSGSALSATGINPRFWDTLTTITVVLDDDTPLSTHTDEEVLRGQYNWALIGEEIIGFVNATLTATRTYQLTRLLRGRRNTEQHIANHGTSERFILLSGGGMEFVEVGFGVLNTSIKFKGVPSGQIPSDVTEETAIVPTAESVKPFSPYGVVGVRDATGDLTLTWRRRSRTPFRLLGGVLAPLDEPSEAYIVEIYNAAETLLLRTIQVTGTPTTIYTAAQQTTDFGSPQASIHIYFYQVSNSLSRGRVEKVVV